VKRIFKYPLKIEDEQIVLIGGGGQVLSVGVQDNRLFVWALVDQSYNAVPIRFYIVGTGNPANHVASNLRFVGTVQMPNGLVWHVFVEDCLPS
jgi:hypothetical protein